MEDIQQPTLDLQERLDDLVNATPEKVMFLGKERTIGWLHNGTTRKFSHIMAKEGNIDKRHAKLAAVVILNNVFTIFFFYWILWRYYFYIKDIDVTEVLKLLNIAKKKVQQEAYYLTIILATGMTDMMMTMTKEEARRIQAAQHGAQPTH